MCLEFSIDDGLSYETVLLYNCEPIVKLRKVVAVFCAYTRQSIGVDNNNHLMVAIVN